MGMREVAHLQEEALGNTCGLVTRADPESERGRLFLLARSHFTPRLLRPGET